MSSHIWIPDELSSNTRKLTGNCWRMVEAQHYVSTLKLVDSLAEQALLENLIEETKPSIPNVCHGLHPLLYTPFRYEAEYPSGSRFRRSGRTEGVYYAAELVETCVTEMVFYRLLFYAESKNLRWPLNPSEYTAFNVCYSAEAAIDLTASPFSKFYAMWTHPVDYLFCQDFADAARGVGVDALRYLSARDPKGGINLAILSCGAIKSVGPEKMQTWKIYLHGNGAQAICEFPTIRLEYGRDTFGADHRIHGMAWDR